MNQSVVISIVVVVILFFILKVKDSYVMMKSSIDNRLYRVKKNKLSEQSANLLAVINKRLLALIEFSSNKSPEPYYKKNLERYNEHSISENILDLDTTYTLNKGDSMVFCLSPRDEDTLSLYDINTMMFVAVHELAHVASNSIGHTEEFKRNFKDLLEDAITIGLYEFVDYSKKPVEYCGITINSTVI